MITYIIIAIPLISAIYFAFRMLYYQIYDRKATYLIISVNTLESNWKFGINGGSLREQPLNFLTRLKRLKKDLASCDIIEVFSPFNELISEVIGNEISKINNKDPDFNIDTIFNYDITMLCNVYSIEFKQRVSNSRALATLFGLFSTMLAVFLK